MPSLANAHVVKSLLKYVGFELGQSSIMLVSENPNLTSNEITNRIVCTQLITWSGPQYP